MVTEMYIHLKMPRFLLLAVLVIAACRGAAETRIDSARTQTQAPAIQSHEQTPQARPDENQPSHPQTPEEAASNDQAQPEEQLDGAPEPESTETTGSTVPVISPGAQVKGLLSRQQIRDVIRANINEIRHCYEAGLSDNPNLEGRVVVRFLIQSSGRVLDGPINDREPSYPEILQSELGNPEIEQCILRRIASLNFPPPLGGGVVIVSYPFRFQIDPGTSANP